MTVELWVLIALMATVTYLSRALPLLVPGADRLSGPVLGWVRPLAPAILASLAASNTLLARSGEQVVLASGPLVPAVLTALAVMYWRRNLPLTITTAVAVAAVLRSFE